MQWWGWFIVALVVMGIVLGLVLWVQSRRRRGGVIIERPTTKRGGRP